MHIIDFCVKCKELANMHYPQRKTICNPTRLGWKLFVVSLSIHNLCAKPHLILVIHSKIATYLKLIRSPPLWDYSSSRITLQNAIAQAREFYPEE